eukprot:TRINITY_DN21991_c0_g1_i4.p1 TRINITY_DN21991_c0_g1~~TRINITY_DN21991_c0_g1_i4.p1  ORF type:complete len:211 (-),score=8.54 TRINITY_DN21991_c0_g1_i4:368-931(-)
MDDDVVPGTAEFSALDSVRGSLFADKSLSTGFDCVGRWFHAKWLGGKIEVVKKPVGGFLYTDSKREVDLGLQEDGWLEGRTPAGGLLRLRCHRSDILVLQEKECLGCDGWGVEVRLSCPSSILTQKRYNSQDAARRHETLLVKHDKVGFHVGAGPERRLCCRRRWRRFARKACLEQLCRSREVPMAN